MKLTLAALAALTLFAITLVSNLPPPAAATTTSFTFAASGDHGPLTNPTGSANLNSLQSVGSDFYLSLGDMSYDPSTTGDAWCSQFKSKFNNIEILPGDHDTGGHPAGFPETHSYEKYLAGCPFNLNTPITCGPIEDNCYGKEYYFDYPSGNPLARFILLSPKIFNVTGVCTSPPNCSSQTGQSCTDQYGCWAYDKNTLHYNWTRGAIDDARNRGIKWVIAATHKLCISSSDATCSIGIDLFNLLISKKVDLIIQAHDNAYERSKQLALNPSNCPSINTNGNGFTIYNSGCIADSGSRGYYTPGAGSVVVVQGAWKNDLYGVNENATHTENTLEAPYFVKLMGKNSAGAGLGFAKYIVSVDRIDVQTYFSGTFQDSFSIWAGPVPVPYASWGPSNPRVGQVVTFNASAQGGTSPYSFAWNFGDGVTSTGGTVRHFYSLAHTFNVTVTATDSASLVGTSRRTIAVGSWNPSVGCSPTVTTVETIVGNVGVLRNSTNPNSVGPDYNGGGFRLDGPLPRGSNPSIWPFSKRNLQPPCSVDGIPTFVEVHSVQVLSTPQPGIASYDCTTRFDSSNGGGPFPNGRDCDYVFNTGNASITTCPDCNFHRIYSEIDHDWNASGVAPTPPPQAQMLDVQGFVFWDPENLNSTQHSFTGWEIHPITAWRIHRAPLSVSFNASPTSPVAGQTATFTATATAGTAPYTYAWDFGDGNTTRGTSNQATHTYSTIGPRVVQLFVNDSLGATGIFSRNVTVVAPIIVNVTCGTATSGKPVTCNASATGGTSPFTFSWSAPGGSPSTGTGSSYATTYATKGTFVVNVTATDANNVKRSQTATVIVTPQPLAVAITCGAATAGKPVTCNASASGGTAPYTFTWASKGTPATGTGSSYTTTFATKGSQVVNATARDNNAVTRLSQATVNVAAQPIVVVVTCGTPTVNQPVTCNASATGGTAPYTLTWASTGTPATGAGPSYTTVFATKGPQVINATASDNNAVTKLGQTTVSVVGQPIVVTVTCGTATAGKPITCNASATGGTAPFTFSWSAPGGSPAIGTGASFTTTYATKGNRTVNATVTDANNARKFVLTTISVGGQPIVVTISQGATATVGKPVTFTASATGGTGPYTFAWSAPGGGPATGTGASFTVTYSTSGSKTITANATDANAVKASQTLTFNVQTQSLVIQANCPSGTAGKPITCTSTVSGGTAPYAVTWTSTGTPATFSRTGAKVNYTVTFASKGTFPVNATVVDSTSPTHLRSSRVVNAIITAQPIVVTVTCGTATAGKPVTCNASATGGTSPITFSWSAPNGSPATGSGASFTTTYAAKGTFVVNVTATDANNVKKSATASLTVAAQPLVADFSFTQPVVAGSPATFTATITGGTPPYMFKWSFGDGSPFQSSNPVSHIYSVKGSYSVTLNATDANSAIVTVKKTVLVTPPPLLANFTYSPSAPTVNQTVFFTATVSGGTAPYSTGWDFGDNTTGIGITVSHMYNVSKSYTITLTAADANSASATYSKPITVVLPISVMMLISQAPAAGWPTNFIGNATGGAGGYSYAWSFGDGANGTSQILSHVYSSNGTYTVSLTVTDSSGNTASKSKQVLVMLDPDIDGNGVVDIGDVANVALAFESVSGDARYNSRLDLNFDGKIDISDVAGVAIYFGRTISP